MGYLLSKQTQTRSRKPQNETNIITMKLMDYSYHFSILIDLCWSIIASQYCVTFCCTTKRTSHMHVRVPISPPTWASLPSFLSDTSRSSQSTEPISLCYAVASHYLFTFGSVYMSMLLSLCPSFPLPAVSSSPFSMSTSLFLPYN